MLYMFDLDDTLIEGYLSRPEGEEPLPYEVVTLLPGRRDKIRTLAEQGDASFSIVTNQGGVAFGYNTVEEVRAKLAKTLEIFDFFQGCPVSIHYCLTHPDAPEYINGEQNPLRQISTRRKPGVGMLDEAMVRHRIKARTNVVYVGDLVSDEMAARGAGVAFFYASHFFGENA